MLVVLEVWYLKQEYADGSKALAVMQEMEDLLEPGAHANGGWTGHAKLYQYEERAEVLMVYPWRDKASHALLLQEEEPKIQGLYQRYCSQPRTVHYLREIPVKHED